MTSPQAAKGAKAEREFARIISDELGYEVKRRRNLGTHEDIGDLIGLPNTTLQICSRDTNVVSVGVVNKPLEVDQQARNAGTTFAATGLRIRGGIWRVVLTVPQWATLWREATA